MPIDEYDAVEETAEILSDPDAIAVLEKGHEELELGAGQAGDSVGGSR